MQQKPREILFVLGRFGLMVQPAVNGSGAGAAKGLPVWFLPAVRSVGQPQDAGTALLES